MLTTANVWTTVFIHVGVILAAVAYYTVGAALLPNVTRRGAACFAARPLRTVLVGVAISAPAAVASIVLLQAGGAIASLGALIGLAWILLGLMGGAAVAHHVGQAGDDWRRVARGGLLVALTWVLPLIGWFFMLPLTLATGVGCLIAGWRQAPAASAEPTSHALPS